MDCPWTVTNPVSAKKSTAITQYNVPAVAYIYIVCIKYMYVVMY